MFVKIMVVVVVIAVIGVITLMALVLTKPHLFDKRIKDEDTPISYEDVKQQDKSSGNSGGFLKNEDIGDTKSFYPVKSFEDFAFGLGRHNYRAIIECSSVNYSLMSDMEQEMVEASYTQFLNSLRFPITIYIQTREFDSESMMSKLKENIEYSRKLFPDISEYAEHYQRDMEYLTQYIGNSKIKKKYIIVPYNNSDLSDVSALSNYEIKQFALEELMSRCSIVINGIEATGITAKLLNKSEIAECLYSYYHRDTYKIASDIIMGEFTTLAVNGEDLTLYDTYESKRKRLDLILNETQERIKAQAKYKGVSKEEQNFYMFIYETLEQFKQDGKAKDIFTLLDETEDLANKNGYRFEYFRFKENHKRPEPKEKPTDDSLTVPYADKEEPVEDQYVQGVPSNEENSDIFTSQNTGSDNAYYDDINSHITFDFGDDEEIDNNFPSNTGEEGSTDILTSDMFNNQKGGI